MTGNQTYLQRRGFTLVELMVVITVIGILAALTVSAAFQVRYSMRIRTARASAGRMAQAIETYKALQGFLPAGAHLTYEAGYENDDVIQQLNGVMNRPELFKLGGSELNAAGSFKDPWGEPFRLVLWKESDDDAVCRFFQVYSCGPNCTWEGGRGQDATPPGDDLTPSM